MSKKIALVLAAFVSQIASSNSSAGLKPEVVYGDDDRKEIFQIEDAALKAAAQSTALVIDSDRLRSVNAEEVEVTASNYGEEYNLCSEEPFREQNAAGFCSAFLVAPNKMATAGHCISTQTDCDGGSFVFGFGYDVPGKDLRRVNKSQVYSCKRIIERKEMSSGADYALIELDRPVLEIAPLAIAAEEVTQGLGLNVVGHPAGIPTKVGSGIVRSTRPADYMVTNLDTYGGNSGSAVLRATDHAVVGILVRGEEDFAYRGNCRISNRCTNEGCRGEDVTRIRFIREALKK